jgi:hypothetical protein
MAVAVNQIWESLDARDNGRRVKVLALESRPFRKHSKVRERVVIIARVFEDGSVAARRSEASVRGFTLRYKLISE